MISISEKLKQIRQNLRLSQAEMAVQMGVAQSTYSAYEAGKSEPGYSEIVNLMAGINLKPSALFEIEGSFPSANEFISVREPTSIGSYQAQVTPVLPEHVQVAYEILCQALDAAKVDISTMDRARVGLVIGLAAEEVAKGNREEARRTLIRRAEVLLGLRPS